jgi:hypothetical protein
MVTFDMNQIVTILQPTIPWIDISIANPRPPFENRRPVITDTSLNPKP